MISIAVIAIGICWHGRIGEGAVSFASPHYVRFFVISCEHGAVGFGGQGTSSVEATDGDAALRGHYVASIQNHDMALTDKLLGDLRVGDPSRGNGRKCDFT